MSRIGAMPVDIPHGVTVETDGRRVAVKGPQGELSLDLPSPISVKVDGKRIEVCRPEDSKRTRSLHGLSRTLVANMVSGVVKGSAKELEVEGVGFKADVQGGKLVLSLGFSKPVEYVAPPGIKISVAGNVITVGGPDKQKVGEVAALIRALHPPEPYKGKGIRYKGEHVRRKAGKTVA